MGYLEEFQYQINNRDFRKFFQLWEEYCTNDQVDFEEFKDLLDMIQGSEFAELFGQFVETALPLWQSMEDENDAYEILKRLLDLQTTNAPALAEIAYDALEKRYGTEPTFREKIRQIGLHTRKNFQGAISNYELLRHMDKGKFVFHTSSWGTGEVMDISPLREQVAIEFESVAGIKHLTFDNAFKTLIPLKDDHFLSRRFADPDLFEKQARKNPIDVIKILLRDLGPKTAADIKEELCVLVIPEKDWSRWWQTTRSKLKKDPFIESPSSLQDPFLLRAAEVSHKERLHQAVQNQTTLDGIIQTYYSFVRDIPHLQKEEDIRKSIIEKLVELLSHEEITQAQELQIYIFFENLFDYEVEGRTAKKCIEEIDDVSSVIHSIDIVAFKKRALALVRKYRTDWVDLFLSLLFSIKQNLLRDYLFKELRCGEGQHLLNSRLDKLIEHPEKDPETFLWYFQKVSKGSHEENLPFSDKGGQCRLLEALLILLHKCELSTKHREYIKKIYAIVTASQFMTIRKIIKETSLAFIEEFLLLASKCQTFSSHEQKIMHSLARVVQPSLAPDKKPAEVLAQSDVLWTTEDGYLKTQERIKHIATVEMVENAREVEAARALGDLRENAEYKFAVEKRARLQGEMKSLSKQLSNARILTQEDVSPNEVDIGSVVDLENSKGEKISFTILGPWEANPEEQIISYKSQFATAMLGHRVADTFTFRDEEYTVRDIKTIFNHADKPQT